MSKELSELNEAIRYCANYSETSSCQIKGKRCPFYTAEKTELDLCDVASFALEARQAFATQILQDIYNFYNGNNKEGFVDFQIMGDIEQFAEKYQIALQLREI